MQNISELVDAYRCHHVFPVLAIELCAVHSEEVSVRELVDIIGRDTGLSLEIVALSNAPCYGANVHSLNDAILVMGIQRTVNVAIGFVLLRVLVDTKSSRIDLVQYRSRSFLSAIACQAIGRIIGCKETGRFFLAGLLQDIGMLVFDDAADNQYEKCLEQQQYHDSLSIEERRLYGIDHATLGAALMDSMGLPNDLVIGVLNSHNLLMKDDLFSLSVALSGHISDIFLLPDHLVAYGRALIYANSYLKISDTAFADIVEAVSQEAAQTSTYFGVNIKPQRICDMLRSKAQEEAAHTRT